MKKALLATLFALALSTLSVSAQTQPAQMGVTPTTLPEVLQVLDNTQIWVTIGTFTGGAFVPATNGAITPGDCIKWGPGLTDANAACGGGGGGGGPFTIFATHANLLAGATRPTGPYTLYQQGFSAAGKFGAARYEWDATSYCVGGTSSVPVAADGNRCILPVGQAAATAGRFLLQLLSDGLDLTTIGMLPGGQDNAPFVPALMSAMGAPSQFTGGYTAFFPPILGQQITSYYFANSLDITRGMRLKCGGGPLGFSNSVMLVFAPGVDGVINNSSNVSSDGGSGSGTVEGCGVSTQGKGHASAAPNSNSITGAVFNNGDIGNILPLSAWTPGGGDGVIAMPTAQYGIRPSAGPVLPPGAWVQSVSGSTLTLASPFVANPKLGAAIADFQETGSNNFNAGDTFTVGNSAYTFVSAIGSTPGNVLIGSDASGSKLSGAAFLATSTNLFNCINNNVTTSTCVAQTTAPNVKMSPPGGTVLDFYAATGGTAGNSLASTYAPIGTSAGAFIQGSVPHNVFAAGQATVAIQIWQLPAAKVYTINTTTGSPTVTVSSGPKPLEPGDFIWSDAFPIWTVVSGVSGQTFPQTVTMDQPFLNATGQNASATETAGKMWLLPALLKRRTQSFSKDLSFLNGVIGLEMSCGSHTTPAFNCTSSGDDGNQYQENGWGKIATGSNYSGSGSKNESLAKNYFGDLADLGALGMSYVNLTAHSGESGTASQGIVVNCNNQNASIFWAGYMGVGGVGQCAQSVGLLPGGGGGAINFGPMSLAWNGAASISNGQNSQSAALNGQWQVFSGWNGQNCISLGGSPTLWYTFGFSNSQCSTASTWGLGWNANLKAWNLGFTNTGFNMFFGATALGYTGYVGQSAGIVFPQGLVAYNTEDIGNAIPNARMICMSATLPTGTWHKKGDICFNTNPAHGSPMGWANLADGANFAPLANIP